MSETDTSPTSPASNPLIQLLIAWINTGTWEQSKEMLKEHADRLISDDALNALETLLAAVDAEDANDEENKAKQQATLQAHKTILEQARVTSIDEAYSELLTDNSPPDDFITALQAIINAESPAEVIEQIQQHPILLTPEAIPAIETFIANLRENDQSDLADHIAQRLEMLKQVVEANRDPLNLALQAIINAKSPAEVIEQTKQHPILLESGTLTQIEELLTNLRENNQSDLADHIAQRLETLKQEIEDRNDPLNLAINALLHATHGTLHQVIEQNPVLLDDETLASFEKFAMREETSGDSVVAAQLRLRLSEVRRIQREGEEPSQQYSDNEAAVVDEPPVRGRGDNTTNIGRDSYGNITQFNADKIEMTLPPKKWQPPANPSLPKTFVGRKEELDELSKYIIAGEHVTISGHPTSVMLQGMGGIGKTYLATQLAIDVQQHFPGGVIFIKLGESVRGEQDIQDHLRQLASYAFAEQTLSFIEQLRPQKVKDWLEEMAPGRLLIVFDDVWAQEPLRLLEQAIPANAVRIVTTRDANIAQTLDGKKKELDRLKTEEGMALLEVRLGCQGVTTYHEGLKKLVEVLGGHAQALDIIAARIKKPQRIAAILQELKQGKGQARLSRLKLRGGQTRVDNLEKSLGLSYDYMSFEEKRCFRTLGVFVEESLITVEAVHAIWGMNNLVETHDLLRNLVDLSMLEEVGDVYRQHGLLQTYAYALMEEAREVNNTCWALAEYYKDQAWEIIRKSPGDYSLLDQHTPNLLSALEWTNQNEPQLFSQLVEVLFQFLHIRGQSQKLEEYLPKAEAIAKQTGNFLRQANLLKSLGDLENHLGNLDAARTHYDAALPLFRAVRSQLGEANLLKSLGDLENHLGNLDAARTHYDAALPLFRAVRDQLGEANVYRGYADLLLAQGDLTNALQYSEKALQLYIDERSPLGQANALMRLGTARFESGNHQQGLQDIQQAVNLYYLIQDTASAHNGEQHLIRLRKRLEQPDGDTSAANLVIDFTRGDWKVRHQILSQHADVLLNEKIDQVVTLLVKANQAPEVQKVLENVGTLLRRCRTWGVEPVFYFERHMRLGNSIEIPAAYEEAVMRIAALLCRQENRESAREEAIAAMKALLDRLTSDVPPLFEAALLRDLCETLEALPTNHPARKLEAILAYYQEALPLYEVGERPISVAYIQRSIGNVLSNLGRYEATLPAFQAAEQGLLAQEHTRSDAAWALSAHAYALDRLDRIEEAVALYTQAIALLPDTPALLRNRSEPLIHAWQLDEAEADLAQAVALDGNEDSSYLWYHRAQLALARGDGVQADAMLDEVRQRAPEQDVTFLRGQSAWLRGDMNTVEATLQSALAAANEGEWAAMRLELRRLLARYPDLPALPAAFL